MTGNVVIRRAAERDVSSIVELWKELMDFHKRYDRYFSRSRTGHEGFEDFIRGHIRSDTSCVFVAEAGEDIVGYCLVAIEKYPPVLEIQEYGRVHNLAVTKDRRGKGIGKRLFRKAVNWFRRKGIHRIEVCVATSNELAREFWARMGFTPYLETGFMKIP